MKPSAGEKLKRAIKQENPLQVVGTINAYASIMAEEIGFKAIYLSGAGVANSSYGLHDLGIISLENLLEDARRITSAVDLPLIVDIDTGWGNPLIIQRAVKEMTRASAAAVHIEDQETRKRCGHLPGKKIVSIHVMQERIKAAADAREDPEFAIIARTDAFASEGLNGTIDRAGAYKEAGCDILFPEALSELEQYVKVKEAIGIPILINLTEFGRTPLCTLEEVKKAGVDIALYPLSANRAMNLAALKVFREIRASGTQKSCLEQMQTREELYYFLDRERRRDG